jgi:AcrR family transcriptional regulator
MGPALARAWQGVGPMATSAELILGAPIEEFSERGFAGARVDAIARRAGANKQLLFYYFRDKQGLHDASGLTSPRR